VCHIVVEEVEKFVWSFDGSFVIAIGEGGIDLLSAIVFWESVGTEMRTVLE
jgi:hypothetical protein